MKIGQIFKIHSDFYYVHSDGVEYECKVRDVLKKQKQKIYVGDYVEFENGAIKKIQPRKNFITRPTVANVDQIIIISAVKEPDLDFSQLNRYITFAKYYNIKTVLCFNKNDLSEDDKIIEKVFSIYQPLGYDILFTSALQGDGIEDLSDILKGKVSVFCGQSGVGKSSLINAICPRMNIRTKNVSARTGRGTHTTRHCEIISVADNSRIVDTPGFSRLTFDFLMPYELGNLFEEISQYKDGCKFKNCLHLSETGCAVIENLDKIDETRYKSYVEFVEEAKEYREKIKKQGSKIETSHKQQFNKTAVKISLKKREVSRNTKKQKIYKDVEHERIDRVD